MAANAPQDLNPNAFRQQGSDINSYISLGNYLNSIDMPDNISRLVATYGDQRVDDIYGFLTMAGAVKSGGSNDIFQFWEEGRLYNDADGTAGASISAGASTSLTITTPSNHKVRLGNEVLIYKGNHVVRTHVTAVPTATTYTVAPAASWPVAITSGETLSTSITFLSKKKASDQPVDSIVPNLRKRSNTYIILADHFEASGSEMTNKSWVTLPDGKQAWFYKGEQDTLIRARGSMEMAMILAQKYTNSTLTDLDLNGTEGYFAALEGTADEPGGIINSGYIESLDDIEDLIEKLDTQGGSTEYAGYVNRKQLFKFSNMMASLTQDASYGLFDNKKDMALSLDFTGMSYGGTDFYFHLWKLLVEPKLLGKQDIYKGVLIPTGTIRNSKTGEQDPMLQIRYKELDGYSREFESWTTGAANGIYTDSAGKDVVKHDFRSEQMLVVMRRNAHVLIK